jgi:hypothetical protein
MKLDQAGNVTGGIVLRSGPALPFFIHEARFGSRPSAIMGSMTLKLAPSSARTSAFRETGEGAIPPLELSPA